MNKLRENSRIFFIPDDLLWFSKETPMYEFIVPALTYFVTYTDLDNYLFEKKKKPIDLELELQKYSSINIKTIKLTDGF
jgi:hypothetical protein